MCKALDKSVRSAFSNETIISLELAKLRYLLLTEYEIFGKGIRYEYRK